MNAFEDSDIAKNVKLSGAEATDMIKFGLAPYFHENIFSELNHSSFYTLYFDQPSTKPM